MQLLLKSYGKANTFMDMSVSTTFGQLSVHIGSILPETMMIKVLDYYERILYAITEDSDETIE
ncbi:hypothetical protein D3C86_2172450 [compost metagenome]